MALHGIPFYGRSIACHFMWVLPFHAMPSSFMTFHLCQAIPRFLFIDIHVIPFDPLRSKFTWFHCLGVPCITFQM